MPIGSGGIESANKFIGHVRLKRPGAWWVVENARLTLIDVTPNARTISACVALALIKNWAMIIRKDAMSFSG